MEILKVTEEYRVNLEEEVKQLNEKMKSEATEKGYILNAFSYTKKEKKSKGEIIDEGYLVKAVKVYGGFWE
jgi:hypothetical protein